MTNPFPLSRPSVDVSRRSVHQASFVFDATLQDVSLVAQALRLLIPVEVGEEARNEIEIGVVEAMTNIVRHSYGNSEAGIIAVIYDFAGDSIIIKLTDHGKPVADVTRFQDGAGDFDFDPEDIGRLPEGGMGILLTLATFDRVEYGSEGGANMLMLVKNVSAG